ncbi:MAG: leucyl/phenylalanyl-tRNA--protein transferase [Bacillota bacterium]
MSKKKSYFTDDDLLIPENMIMLYARGAFPMSDENGKIDWYFPDTRTVIPLENYNYPRSLRKFMETSAFEYKFDSDYLSVIKNCADRETTWISEKLINAYQGLYEIGHLHSVETWLNGELVGGLYGVSFRGAFFGESMFSKVSQASKASLIKLIEHLRQKGFLLLDVQYQTEHLKMFGAKEISLQEFDEILLQAYKTECSF